MKSVLIKNATLVNEGVIAQLDVLISGKYIVKIEEDIEASADEIIDAKGKYLLPGLIDDQVHFREPGLTHKANIESESKAAVAGGITSFIEMPNTNPQTTTIEELNSKFERAAKSSWANYSFMFGGTNDNLEEIKKLNINEVAGLKLFLGSSTGNMLVDNPNTLKSIFESTDLVISLHCEDEATIRKNTQQAIDEFGEDIPISHHPKIRSEEACYLSSSKAVQLAKETGARIHVFHISTAKELSLFRNDIPLKEKKITAEVCIHHLWFSEEDYKHLGTKIKWNPAVKKATDREALWEALNNDTLDILASDHAPHTFEEKSNTYLNAPSGGPLVQHVLLALLTAYKKDKISLEKIVEKACHNPAILFQIEKRGFLKEGYFADFVLVDLNKKTKVSSNNILYKCQWSPFEGDTFEASVDQTWVNGTCVYKEGKVSPEKVGMKLNFER